MRANLHEADGRSYCPPEGASLPAGMTKWEIVLDQLTTDLERIPFAAGQGEGNPTSATIETANYEFVKPATQPGSTPLTASILLPFVNR